MLQHSSGGVILLAETSPKVRAQLDANQALMLQLGYSATPSTRHKDTQGKLKSAQGAPHPEMLGRILDPR
jgi:thiol:disulfide interchange protein DsbG